MWDPPAGRRRAVHALIFTAVVSRHMFVCLSFQQALATVIEGCERAWEFFGGVFAVLIPDNMSPIVADADPVNPTFTAGWLDYAQARGCGTVVVLGKNHVSVRRLPPPASRLSMSRSTGWSTALSAIRADISGNASVGAWPVHRGSRPAAGGGRVHGRTHGR